jgi:4-hydroxy-tetrahydrodipicolinate synthase
MVKSFLEGDLASARRLHYKLQPLNRAMFTETNPIPVKTALSLMGAVVEEFRLPLVKMAEANKAKLLSVMKAYGLAVAEAL